MKTVIAKEKGSTPFRTSDEKAKELVKSGLYKYCPKHIWKEKVRDFK